MLRLKAAKEQSYDNNYHYKVQSFLYNLIRNTEFYHLHDSIGKSYPGKTITPFCFSNLFPYGNMNQGSRKSMMISSPNEKFLTVLLEKIKGLEGHCIHFGELLFDVVGSMIFSPKLITPLRFTTMTPIILRIPRANYQVYDLDLKYPYEYIFWRENYPLELFINQVESNLKNKFTRFYNREPEQTLKFSNLVFKKQVSKKIVIRGMVQTIIGTLWEFWLENINELAEFSLDAGLGERNSLGFGFLNSD